MFLYVSTQGRSLSAHLPPNINWLLDDPARIKDYDDYIFVEFLPLLEIDPSFRESLLIEHFLSGIKIESQSNFLMN